MLGKAFAAVTCGTIIAYPFLGDMILAIGKSLAPLHTQIISLELSEGCMLNLPMPELKLAFPVGVLISAPVLLWVIAEYLLPTVTQRERKLVFRSTLAGAAVYVAGVAGGYFLLLPTAVRIFTEWSYSYSFHEKGVVLLDQYFAFVADFLLFCGLLCEVPFVALVLAKNGLLTRRRLSWTRLYAIILPLVILALIAPNSELFTFVTVALSLAVVSGACVARNALRGWQRKEEAGLQH